MADPANNAPPAPANENPPPANTDPNAGKNTPPSNEPPPANTATTPASDPKPQETPPNTDPKPDGQTQPTNDPPPADILDLAKSGEEKEAQAKEQAKADFDAYVKDAGLKDGITDLVVRKGENGQPDVTLPAQEVGAIFSVLKATGIPADKAKDMLGMVSALDQFRAAAQQKRDEQTLNQIRAEAAKEFGDNLTTAARDMVAGGQRLFGAELWKDICTIPALVNDKRFIRAMSAYGRSGRNDSGGPAPTSGGATGGKIVFDLDAFSKGTI